MLIASWTVSYFQEVSEQPAPAVHELMHIKRCGGAWCVCSHARAKVMDWFVTTAGCHLEGSPGSGPGFPVQTRNPGPAHHAPLCHRETPWRWSEQSRSYALPPWGAAGVEVRKTSSWKEDRRSLDVDTERREGEKLRGSPNRWVGLVGGDEERVWTEPPVQVPERTVSQDRDSGSCPYRCKHSGLKVCGSQGHSGCLRGSCVAWPHSAQIWGLWFPQVPTHKSRHRWGRFSGVHDLQMRTEVRKYVGKICKQVSRI